MPGRCLAVVETFRFGVFYRQRVRGFGRTSFKSVEQTGADRGDWFPQGEKGR